MEQFAGVNRSKMVLLGQTYILDPPLLHIVNPLLQQCDSLIMQHPVNSKTECCKVDFLACFVLVSWEPRRGYVY